MVGNALESKGCLLLSARTSALCLALFSRETQSQSSVCTVNMIKRKPLETSKGKLGNMC